MDVWEAKYQALCAGISNKDMIENAELLVEKAIALSTSSCFSLQAVCQCMLYFIGKWQTDVALEEFDAKNEGEKLNEVINKLMEEKG